MNRTESLNRMSQLNVLRYVVGVFLRGSSPNIRSNLPLRWLACFHCSLLAPQHLLPLKLIYGDRLKRMVLRSSPKIFSVFLSTTPLNLDVYDCDFSAEPVIGHGDTHASAVPTWGAPSGRIYGVTRQWSTVRPWGQQYQCKNPAFISRKRHSVLAQPWVN
jgi:hypothetical protein